MIKYILKRVLYLIPVMLLVTLIVFFLMSITKGDPARIVVGESASLEEVEAMREQMGLNDPFLLRYVRYVRDLFLRGDLGTSYKSGLPVMEEITSALPSTIKLSLAAIVIAVLVGIPIGIIYTAERIYKDPHLAARDHFTHVRYPGVEKEFRYLRLPFRSSTCAQRYERAPELGEHNGEFFGPEDT